MMSTIHDTEEPADADTPESHMWDHEDYKMTAAQAGLKVVKIEKKKR